MSNFLWNTKSKWLLMQHCTLYTAIGYNNTGFFRLYQPRYINQPGEPVVLPPVVELEENPEEETPDEAADECATIKDRIKKENITDKINFVIFFPLNNGKRLRSWYCAFRFPLRKKSLLFLVLSRTLLARTQSLCWCVFEVHLQKGPKCASRCLNFPVNEQNNPSKDVK